MKTFEDLKSEWRSQPQHNIPADGTEVILKKMKTLKTKQRILNVVLLATVAVLVVFFFFIDAYKYNVVSFALLLMIGALFFRVFMELSSIKKLKRINVTASVSVFNKNIYAYYKGRVITHYIFTPIIILCYITGFIILLPFFKESLSTGFYSYIVVSAIVLLIIFVLYIRKEIKKELRLLKALKI